MTPHKLARKIGKLDARPSITSELERALEKRGDWNRSRAWYKSQKEHWLGWLSGYEGAGHYGRKDWNRSAEFIYNHIVCPPMVLWLGEASGIPKATVREAKQAALSARPSLPAQSAAIRKVIRWDAIEVRLTNC